VIQPNSPRATAQTSEGLASWYTPGLVDGFGDRLLMFDNTETDSLELLRFYPSLIAIAGFEDALHERVRQVGRLPDHAFPLIVAVERLEGDGALALVSTHTPGKRLSAFFDRPGPRKGLNPSFVTGVVTQIVQALTVLQSKGDDITHSALTADRVVITTGGRVCVIEHVLGSALRRLNLSTAQLWREFGLVSAPVASGALCLDARTDVFQLGVLTLEMLLGRRLTPLDLKDRLADLLEQWSDAATRVGLATDRLKYWLERALQCTDESYTNAAEALADLREMPAESPASAFDALPGSDSAPARRTLQPAKQATGQDPHMANASAPDDLPMNTVPQLPRPALIPAENRWADSFVSEPKPATAVPRPLASPAVAAEAAQAMAAPAPAKTSAPPPKTSPPPVKTAPATPKTSTRRALFKAPRVSPVVAAALGGVALVEAVVIVALLMRAPQTAAATPPPAPTTAAQTVAAAPVVQASAVSQPAATVGESPERPDPVQAAAGKQRSGGVRLLTPIELKVLEGEKVLGSTADGAIIATAGTHQLDLINSALGVRVRKAVTFRAGEIANFDVALPQGRVSVNAQPWAEVLIDNKPVGETPLANVAVPLGDHEVVFRHPELGERRQTITVRGDQPTRVSQSFNR
jgi:hypothetical protein